MSLEFEHVPVMLDEVVELMRPVPAGWALDATVGAGGHAEAVLDACAQLKLLGIDKDPAAVEAATARLDHFKGRAVVRSAGFEDMARVLAGLPGAPDGAGSLSAALFDLGVSSPQVDIAARGFSYRYDAPLDMRMAPDQERSAYEVVNMTSAAELAELLRRGGEERYARLVARAIVGSRPVTTTGELAEVVRRAVPGRSRRRGDPSKRTFQAVRVAVNDELENLASALPAAIGALVPGGRCMVIAYHSGEDRLSKAVMAAAVSGGCRCPKGLPCGCGASPTALAVTRGALRPSAVEVQRNPRASSARLRCVERTRTAGGTGLGGWGLGGWGLGGWGLGGDGSL
ncbi:MAG: 16S rRNA (cytosine(1402)-N(4))-methyltransferase RsmH [Acidimicrobiales bacterium]